jgi:hypothetical protein
MRRRSGILLALTPAFARAGSGPRAGAGRDDGVPLPPSARGA